MTPCFCRRPTALSLCRFVHTLRLGVRSGCSAVGPPQRHPRREFPPGDFRRHSPRGRPTARHDGRCGRPHGADAGLPCRLQRVLRWRLPLGAAALQGQRPLVDQDRPIALDRLDLLRNHAGRMLVPDGPIPRGLGKLHQRAWKSSRHFPIGFPKLAFRPSAAI